MKPTSTVTKIGLASAGLVAGIVLAGTVGAQAATSTPAQSSTSTSTATTPDAHPGDSGADGTPEASEVHDGHGHGLDLSGTITAVTSSTVTIKTTTGTADYTVPSSADIDKNGEAALSALAVGDTVTFSVSDSNAKQIVRLHAGDETKDMPTGTAPSGTATG